MEENNKSEFMICRWLFQTFDLQSR